MKNWIITEQGDAVNLDFVTKVVLGENLVTPVANSVFIYHGISEGKGSTIKYVYGTSAEAMIGYKKILGAMKQLQIVTDLRTQETLDAVSIDVSTGTIAGGDIVVLTGTGFTSQSGVSINGIGCTQLVNDIDTIQFITPANPAGVYGIKVDNGNGNTSTLAASFTYS